MSEIAVATWNVNGLRTSLAELQILTDEKVDVICLQEVKMRSAPASPDGYVWFWNECTRRAGYSGTAMLIRCELDPELVSKNGVTCCSDEGRDIMVHLHSLDVTIVCVYVPNSGVDRKNPLRRLEFRTKEWDPEFAGNISRLTSPVIVCGDLNVAVRETDVHNPKTLRRKAGFTQEERDSHARNLGCLLEDAHEECNGTGERAFTFWGRYPGLKEADKGWRLDYQLFSPGLSPISAVVRRDFDSSDHCPLLTKFRISSASANSASHMSNFDSC